jgi:hypothetical protein
MTRSPVDSELSPPFVNHEQLDRVSWQAEVRESTRDALEFGESGRGRGVTRDNRGLVKALRAVHPRLDAR